MIALTILAVEKCHQNQNKATELTKLLEIKSKEAEKFKTESGLNAAKAEQAQASLADFKEAYGKEIRKLKAELRIKPKSITEYVEVQIGATDTVYLEKKTQVVILRDTTYEGNYVYDDEFNHFEAWSVNDVIGLVYSIEDSLHIANTYDKKLFKRGEYTTTVFSMNPSVSIRGVNSVKIKERVKRFAVGPQIGVLIGRDFRPAPYVGVGATYGLVRF